MIDLDHIVCDVGSAGLRPPEWATRQEQLLQQILGAQKDMMSILQGNTTCGVETMFVPKEVTAEETHHSNISKLQTKMKYSFVPAKEETSLCGQAAMVSEGRSHELGKSHYIESGTRSSSLLWEESMSPSPTPTVELGEESMSPRTPHPPEFSSVGRDRSLDALSEVSSMENQKSESSTLAVQNPHYVNELIKEYTKSKTAKSEGMYAARECVCAALIVANSIFMGMSVQYHADTGRELSWERAANLLFTLVFTLEIVVRVWQERLDFFYGADWSWNCFDSLVVSCMLVEEVLSHLGNQSSSIENVSLLRMLRLLRVIRVFRALKLVRYFQYFRAGRLLIMSLLTACQSVVWIVLLLASMAYMVSLAITTGTLTHCAGSNVDPGDESSKDELCVNFGTVWRSGKSTYEAMLGGASWGTLLDTLERIEFQYSFIFVVVITFNLTVFMQMLTGVFVWAAHTVVQEDKKFTFIADQKKENRDLMTKLVAVFQKLDINESGVVTREELELAFSDMEMSAVLASLELDAGCVEHLFELLDNDRSGHLDVREFISGCLKFRGKARAIDLERTMKEVSEIRSVVDNMNAHWQVPSYRANVKRARTGSTISHRAKPFAFQKLGSASQSQLLEQTSASNSNRIDSTEMRAMFLFELEDTVQLIAKLCPQDAWTDQLTGEALSATRVNLYHFNYYYMSPKTCSSVVILKGLQQRRYQENQTLKQVQASSGRILGRGRIVQDVSGTDVEITLLVGQFFPQHSFQSCKVLLEDEEDCDCGTPQAVVMTDSCSYKELLSGTPTKPDWFCCHWWGEPVFEFVKCVQEHAMQRKRDKYWVCAYANRQHDLEADISDDPEESCFRRAMRHAEGLLLVLDPTAVPFTRIWCDFELFKTVTNPDKMLDIVTLCGSRQRLLTERPLPQETLLEKTTRERKFPVDLLTMGIQVSLENGTATVEEDKQRILHSMGKDSETGDFDEERQRNMTDYANRRVRGYFAVAAWPKAVKEGRVRDFTRSFNRSMDSRGEACDVLSLPDVLKQDNGCTALELSFSGIREFNDTELESMSEGLPSSLTSLTLSCESCTEISDAGIRVLANRIAQLPLLTLKLDLLGCKLVTDAGLCDLSQKLPATLTEVRFDFALIPHISKESVRSLAQHLPAGVTKLKAIYKSPDCDYNLDSVRQLRKTAERFGSRSSFKMGTFSLD